MCRAIVSALIIGTAVTCYASASETQLSADRVMEIASREAVRKGLEPQATLPNSLTIVTSRYGQSNTSRKWTGRSPTPPVSPCTLTIEHTTSFHKRRSCKPRSNIFSVSLRFPRPERVHRGEATNNACNRFSKTSLSRFTG